MIASSPPLHRTSLRHPQGETEVLIGAGALGTEGGALLADRLSGRLVFVVTTRRVTKLHGERLAPLLDSCGQVVTLTVPEGEAAKTVSVASRLWRRLLAAGGKRDSRIVAFGGGSVGDLAGFVAATFLRGVEVVQLPTTLLAQVDASLGGKTGIDLPGAKNAVGVFHHPEAVIADTRLLGTLPVEELRSGLVEAVKMALVLDADLFGRIEAGLPALLAGDAEALAPVVASAAAAKIGVVERDPGERDERRALNLGHTLGHALESASSYRGLRHGEAVGYGLLFALRLAEARGLDRAEPALFGRTRRLLTALGLPPLPATGLDPAHLGDLATRDKKARRGGMVWVLPEAIGGGRAVARMVDGPELPELVGEIASFLADPFAART